VFFFTLDLRAWTTRFLSVRIDAVTAKIKKCAVDVWHVDTFPVDTFYSTLNLLTFLAYISSMLMCLQSGKVVNS
jgi:hypothetical protein